jgi:biotin operon repressor
MVSNIAPLASICQQNVDILFSRDFTKTDVDTSRKAAEYVLGLQNSSRDTTEHIFNFSYNNRFLYQSQSTIARKLGVTRQTVNENLQRLWKRGLVVKIDGGFNRPNFYVVAPALRTPECLRLLKDSFRSARFEYNRMLLRSELDVSMLMKAPHYPQKLNRYGVLEKAHLIEDPTLKERRENLYLNRTEQLQYSESIYDMRASKKLAVSGYEARRSRVNVKKETFAKLESMGLVFNKPARVDCQLVNDEVMLSAARDFIKWSRTNVAVDPFKVFIGIARSIAIKGGYKLDSDSVSVFSTQYGIPRDEDRVLEYTPSASDNAKNTASKGESTRYPRMKPGSTDHNGDYRMVKKNIESVDVGIPWRVHGTPEDETYEHAQEVVLKFAQDKRYDNACATFGKEMVDNLFKGILVDIKTRNTQSQRETVQGLVKGLAAGLSQSHENSSNLNAEQSKPDFSTNTPGSE